MYEENWKEDKQHWFGTEYWADESISIWMEWSMRKKNLFEQTERVMKENLLVGVGVYRWNDGRVYNGQWKANRMHGVGSLEYPDGRKYEGEWANGVKQKTNNEVIKQRAEW